MGTEVKMAVIPDCDFCKEYGINPPEKAGYDGKTKMGPWAYMCRLHWRQFGIGLGTGKGQRLVKQERAS